MYAPTRSRHTGLESPRPRQSAARSPSHRTPRAPPGRLHAAAQRDRPAASLARLRRAWPGASCSSCPPPAHCRRRPRPAARTHRHLPARTPPPPAPPLARSPSSACALHSGLLPLTAARCTAAAPQPPPAVPACAAAAPSSSQLPSELQASGAQCAELRRWRCRASPLPVSVGVGSLPCCW